MKTLLLLSGGLDSTVLLYHLAATGHSVSCVLFHYGQQHAKKELRFARIHCDIFNQRHGETFGGWGEWELPTLAGSLLTTGDGSKVVPNRNAVLLSVAAAIASRNGITQVAYACNKTDAADFPDCRPEFVEAFSRATQLACGVSVIAPFAQMTKREIVSIGRSLDVPLEATWSCYGGGDVPCETCDACKTRAEALR